MNKLLIVADDYTGALDTGVQFASCGAATCVLTDPACDYTGLSECFHVLVVDAESRHLAPTEAYRIVRRTVQNAMNAGFSYIFKKTDSALRGNIGAELAAVLDATGAPRMSFFPAFPKMKRWTRDGIHYIDGIPVAESLFGKDPFEPVKHSAVADIIHEQVDIPVVIHSLNSDDDHFDLLGIHVFDSDTDGQLYQSAAALNTVGELHYLAGCAGVAAVLPDLLEMRAEERAKPCLTGELLTICGSINPITRKQMERAERTGALRIQLTPEQKLDPDWISTPEGKRTADRWLEQIQANPNAIVECGDDMTATAAKATALGLDLDQTRRRISRSMGGILQRLLDIGLERDILITGGDTLLAFMHRIGQNTLIPLSEPMPGVVLSQICYNGKKINLMSKSGGFGTDTLLLDLTKVPQTIAI